MFEFLRKKLGPVILFLVVGAISLVFVMTDFSPELGGGATFGSNTVATVNGNVISGKDFENAYNQRVAFFKQVMGGKELTEAQIKQFGIRRSTLEGLIQEELFAQEADNLGITVAPEEIKSNIVGQKVFHLEGTNKFDVDTYTKILQANQMSPGYYEALVEKNIRVQKIRTSLASQVRVTPREVRLAYLKDKDQLDMQLVSVESSVIRKNMKISDKQVNEFLAGGEKNEARLKNWFESHKEQYGKKPDFEKVKRKVAREIIQLDQTGEARNKAKKIAESIKDRFSKGSVASLAKKHGFKVETGKGLGRTSRLPGNLQDPRVLKDAFSSEDLSTSDAKVYETAGGYIVAKVLKRTKPDVKEVENLKDSKPSEFEKYLSKLKRQKETRLFESWSKDLREKAEVKITNQSVAS